MKLSTSGSATAEKKNNKAVIITAVVLTVLFVSASVISLILMKAGKNDAVACIYSDGKLVDRISLDDIEDKITMRIDSPDGGYNVVEAEKGKIHVSEASCPDKICMNTGYISDSSAPISCLPNKLLIVIEKKKVDDEPDAVVY